LRLKSYLQEARRNPEQNPKISIIEFLKPYKDKPMYFIHFTDMEKLGINPKYGYNTPSGIYAYPLREMWDKLVKKRIPYRGDSKNVILFEYTGKNYLDIEKYTKENLKDDISKLEKYKSNVDDWEYFLNKCVFQAKKKTPISQLMNITRNLATGSTLFWNRMFRELGYEAIIDIKGTGTIHRHEPTQAVFFSIKDIKIIDIFHNKRYIEQFTRIDSLKDLIKNRINGPIMSHFLRYSCRDDAKKLELMGANSQKLSYLDHTYLFNTKMWSEDKKSLEKILTKTLIPLLVRESRTSFEFADNLDFFLDKLKYVNALDDDVLDLFVKSEKVLKFRWYLYKYVLEKHYTDKSRYEKMEQKFKSSPRK
jgi:hypothetical protein